MAQTSLDIRQSQTRVLQDQLNSAATTQMDSTLASINSELTSPGRLIAASTPSLVVTVGSGTVVNPNTSKNRVIPFISNVPVSFTGGTITFPSGTGTITVSPGSSASITIGASQFVPVLVQLDSAGNINLSVGSAAGTLSAALAAVPTGASSMLSLGYIVVQSNGSSVIQNITNAMLYQFGAGAGSGSGSGGSGVGDDLDSLLYRASFTDTFPESATQSTSSIDASAAHTNATYNSAKTIWTMKYDAGRTTASGTTTTNINLDSTVVGFTAATGDMVIIGGVARKITAVASQSSFTVEAFASAPANGTQATVSQAVHTKDIYNLSVDGSTIASGFPASTFSEITVDYKDNNTSNSNVWTPDVTPNVAFTASPDGTNFTSEQVRSTNITDTQGSTTLPSAGTSLYLRFFANKTTGNGFVNLIMYKAFMQKVTSSGSNVASIANAAYTLSNGAGSPYNCSVAVVGGKTQITLTFQYAVGVNSGSPYGSLDVYVNGQIIPRFISAANNPTGAYYTEVNGNVIQLDSDYTSLGVPIEILQRQQTVDTSTTNTSAISALQEFLGDGFQSFVNPQEAVLTATSITGTPAAGTFYSTIIGRASMFDLSQDLKPKMGIERIMTQQIYQVQNEFGPNGENIWATPNDLFGQIRFVGNSLATTVDTGGQRVTGMVSGDYVEITFYGTGMNMLVYRIDGGSRDVRFSVDGGGESANIMPNSGSGSAALNARNYSENIVVPVTSSLSLGVHTIKLRVANATPDFYGFEILNESSSVKTTPGVGYFKGQKYVTSALNSFSYSAPVSGTRGGRVLVYQNSDGTINTAFQATNGAQANLTSADHTNEDIARRYHFREFGAGRADDFSTLISSFSTRAFTLDDDVATLLGQNVRVASTGAEGMSAQSTAGPGNIWITFVGTGLDITAKNDFDGTTRSFTVTVDGGASIGTISVLGNISTPQTYKVVSGLPYGTHVVKLTNPSATTDSPQFSSFIVYQPKKPSLPSGSIELADYNVLGNFSANATAGLETISQGTLRKQFTREVVLVNGTGGSADWSVTSVDPTLFIGGFELSTDRQNAYHELTFFGTGFDYRWLGGTNRQTSITVSANGLTLNTTNFPGITATVYGNANYSYSTSTGILNSATSSGSVNGGFTITGLPLAKYTIRFNGNNASQFMRPDCMDVIVPIHSYKSNLYADLQNSLPVGSNSISDNRNTTPVKNPLPATKAWAKAYGISSATTTSSALVPMQDMSTTIKTTGNLIEIKFDGSFFCNSAGADNNFQIYVDGVAIAPNNFRNSFPATTAIYTTQLSDIVPVSAGTHKIDIYWRTSAGTLSADNTSRTLLVREL